MPRNVIVISIDSLRFDCCRLSPEKRWLARAGLAGKLETATLDRIGEKSLFFTNAFSTATYTTAAHASLFTGLYPPRHGVRSFFGHRLSPGAKTLAEILRERSYRTFFMSDNPSLFEFTGLTRGFSDRAADEDELVDALAGVPRAGNVFAFAHFFDVHDPYLFSPRYGSGAENADYFSRLSRECSSAGVALNTGDHSRTYYELFYRLGGQRAHFFPWYVEGVNKFDGGRLARFCDRLERELGVFEEWVVAVLSDHGEGRIEEKNGEKFRHEGLLYEEVLRILLMLSYPGAAQGSYGDLASIVDLFPTLLYRAGVDSAGRETAGFDGLVLPEQHHRSVYAESWERRPASLFSSFDNESFLRQRGIRLGSEKLLVNGRPEAFMGEASSGACSIERDLLCRFEGLEQGAEAGEGGGSGQWRADRLIQAFDLAVDPFEDHPLELSSFDACRSRRMLAALGDLMRVEARAVVAEAMPLFPSLDRKIGAILGRVGGQPIALYGAGEHTKMLLARTPIRRANIAVVVDSDQGKWGQSLSGFQVLSPRALTERWLAGVIISSHAFEQEIYAKITGELGIEPAKVFRLYGGSENQQDGYSPEEESRVARQLEELGYS